MIINDGRVLEHNLRQRGLDDIWLDRQLKAHHVKRSQDVFLLTVDEQNQVYLAEKEGGMKRLWIAALLLAVLFGATLCNNPLSAGAYRALNALLEQAEARAETRGLGRPASSQSRPSHSGSPGQLPAHPPAPFRHRSDSIPVSGGASSSSPARRPGVLRRQRPAHDPDLPALRGRNSLP